MSQSRENTMIFPEVFTNLEFQYPDTEISKALACADGLIGWGHCIMGMETPRHFGKGIVKISQVLSINATSDNLMQYADRLMDNK